VLSPSTPSWKVAISESFHQLDDLLQYCEIDATLVDVGRDHEFRLRVTRHFASLIEKGNSRDPLLLQVLPDAQELQLVDGYSKDAVGDLEATVLPGLIHKYHGRVLLTLTGACAIHCRYCFRRHFPYSDNNTDYGANGEVMEYLARHTEISEVILSGGDPLMLSDQKLAELIDGLNRIPHIRVLRVHSRLLSVLPERVSDAFLEVLQPFRGQIVFVTHINHPNEISTTNRNVFLKLSRQGYRLFNQSVLLKRVNDHADTLVDLSNKLFENQITPYYLHRLDKVQGAAHFDMSKQEVCELYG
jgi:EF-P beta-lysylation protein EpmB